MIGLNVKSVGWEEVADELTGRSEKFRLDVERGAGIVGETEVQHFKDQQLSGRNAQDMGLNQVTGNLFRSIHTETISPNLDEIYSLVFNDGADYWEPHQTGTSTLKKRLTLEEHFAEDGLLQYHEMIEEALSKVAA